MTERTGRRVRGGLVYLAASFLFVGLWATLGPSRFYDGFPGAGRHWVAGDGPYNAGLLAQRTERLAYDPGATRAWAPSPEVHSVVVVSGRITVYGPAGERQVYAQGQGFAAGWAPYRTTNETTASAETLITFHVQPR